MPFKWILHDGKPMNVHPILYELQRAKAILEIYDEIYKSALTTGKLVWNDKTKEFDFSEYVLWWTQWNSPLGKHKIMDYPDEDKVLFKDKFQMFLNKFKQGKIANEANSFEYANA